MPPTMSGCYPPENGCQNGGGASDGQLPPVVDPELLGIVGKLNYCNGICGG